MSEEADLKLNRTDYTCDDCYRSFYTRRGLDRHQNGRCPEVNDDE